MSIRKIVEEVERRARTHEIGRLQEIRKEIKGMQRLAGQSIFHEDTIKETYAFHYGGRKELQFNVGIEPDGRIRHAVAYSFEPSQSLPEPELLVPSAKRFNDFFRSYPDHYPDMRMWFWRDGQRSADYRPVPIEPALIQRGVFICMGKTQAGTSIDFDMIVEDFDRLLTLYRFVEGGVNEVFTKNSGFRFEPGCSVKLSNTKASYAQRELDVTLRHNDIQVALHNHLCTQFGRDNVGTERPNAGGKVDVIVHRNGSFWFYEIKTAATARGCISEALSQLLEYSYWPGAQVAERLIVIGEPSLDSESAQYLATLRQRFSLPLEYQRFDLSSGKTLYPAS